MLCAWSHALQAHKRAEALHAEVDAAIVAARQSARTTVAYGVPPVTDEVSWLGLDFGQSSRIHLDGMKCNCRP